MRYARSSLLEVIRQDYLTTARSKGLPVDWSSCATRCRMRLLPLITVIGIQIPALFAGAVVIEQIFSWPGHGPTGAGGDHPARLPGADGLHDGHRRAGAAVEPARPTSPTRSSTRGSASSERRHLRRRAATGPGPAPNGAAVPARSPGQMALRRFLRHRLALLGLVIMAVIAAVSILAPIIAPTDPLKVDLAFFRKPPSPAHWLGTDSAGRDVLSRLIYAGQVSLTVGLVAALMSSGDRPGAGLDRRHVRWLGGHADHASDRRGAVVSGAGGDHHRGRARRTRACETVMLGIGLFFWPTACRIVRGAGAVACASRISSWRRARWARPRGT